MQLCRRQLQGLLLLINPIAVAIERGVMTKYDKVGGEWGDE